MAIVNFSVVEYASNKTQAPQIISSRYRTSGSDDITTVENLEDGSGDISMLVGEILRIHSSAAIWIRFGGSAAASGTGIYIPAEETTEIEAHDAGAVSVVEA